MVDADIATYLGGALADGRAVLFTGAGFSVDAKDRDGRPIPTGNELCEELWDICFPGEERDGSALEDLFQHALTEKPKELEELLRRRLTVDPKKLPGCYRTWFSLPWRRIYTLNVDDLETACAARWSLPRPIAPVSAFWDEHDPRAKAPNGALEVVHLHGHVVDAPHGMTFSTTQYGARLAAQDDPHYAALVRDFYASPFVFVGTRLDESPLWQALERSEGTGGQEPSRPRPRSFIVTSSIERARQSLLERLGVEFLPMSSRDFTEQVLDGLGLERLRCAG
jgi:hypothetical protein